MPKCIVDGKEFEFQPGETVIQLTDRVGISVPRFCYHPGLSVVAQCRMCAVEIEKMPKLQTGCSTPLTDGMVIKTKSEKVKAMQSSVMEFLLINHPLDCPICDKAGECDLQDNSFEYGASDSRYEEQRRTYMDLDMGPVIKKNMNRCIHCTRCIRFCDEVGGYREMIAMNRGNSTEITTCEGRPLETEYAGNLADICPTGSLTLKDFRFKKRVWYLKKTPTICEGCSKGCNIEIHEEKGQIHRLMPRENKSINKWWMCDEGRFWFHHVNSDQRLVEPTMDSGRQKTDWFAAIEKSRGLLKGKVALLLGSDLTLEEMKSAKDFAANQLKGAPVFHFGTPGVRTSADDKPLDEILRRSSKTANLKGAEELGLNPWEGQSQSFEAVLVLTGGRAQLPKNLPATRVGWGVFMTGDASGYQVILPGVSFAEKDGTVVNHDGVRQSFQRAIDPVGQSKAFKDVVGLWA